MERTTRERRDSRHGERFLYAGVAFELLADRRGVELGDEHRAFVRPGPAVADVRCALAWDPLLDPGPEAPPREIGWRWEGARAWVHAGGVRAELLELRPDTYAASATLSATWPWALDTLVTALSAAVVQRRGGLVLHSAGVVLDGRVHLFVGPSGAGKTTAANHCPGATWIARDRSAVVPTADGYRVWGLAGGDPIDLPQQAGGGLPLAAVHRIRRDLPSPSLERLSLADAATVLRESTFSGGGLAEEPKRWDDIEALVRAVPVFALHTCLGEPLSGLLRTL